MTVYEFIQRLELCEPDAQVLIWNENYGWFDEAEVNEVSVPDEGTFVEVV